MASDSRAALVVALSAQLTKFEKDMQGAVDIASKRTKEIEGHFARVNGAVSASLAKAAQSVGGALGGIGSSFLSAAGIAGLSMGALLATTIKLNGELAKIPGLARLAGVSTDKLQEIKFAGALKGVSDDSFTTSLDASVRLLDEAQRNVNTLSRLFNANGISLRNQNGELIKFDQLLEIAAKLMVNTQSEQGKIKIAEMLGLSREWVAVLRDGPEAFRNAAQAAHGAGAVISRDILDKAKEFDKKWNEAVIRFKAGFTEALTDLAEAFSKFWEGLIDSVPGASFIRNAIIHWGGGLSSLTVPELEESIKRSIEQGVDKVDIARQEAELDKRFGTMTLPELRAALGRAVEDGAGGFRAEKIQAAIDKRLGETPLKLKVGVEPPSDTTVIPPDKQKNAFESAVFETNKRIAATDAETRSIGLSNDARERAKVVAELEEAAKKANTDAGFQNATVTDLQRKKIEELADAMQVATKKQHDSHAELARFAVDAGDWVKNIDQTAIRGLESFSSPLCDIGG